MNNDPLSYRSKFVLVVWGSPEAPGMCRGRISVHASEIKTMFREFAVEISAFNLSDISEHDLKTRLQKAMGANYDRYFKTN